MEDFIPKESERSVQFSEKLVTVQSMSESIMCINLISIPLADIQRTQSPTKNSRSTASRHVQIARKSSHDENEEEIPSETDSISTAIDIVDAEDDDIPSNEHISESPVDNMFANLLLTNELPVADVVKKKSPRRTPPIVTTKKPAASLVKFHHTQRTMSDVSDEENTKMEEIPEEISTVNYSEDFSSVPTESSTPRSLTPVNTRVEKEPQ